MGELPMSLPNYVGATPKLGLDLVDFSSSPPLLLFSSSPLIPMIIIITQGSRISYLGYQVLGFRVITTNY